VKKKEHKKTRVDGGSSFSIAATINTTPQNTASLPFSIPSIHASIHGFPYN
jgi:hypothetical protein